jgi:hypothetical protein
MNIAPTVFQTACSEPLANITEVSAKVIRPFPRFLAAGADSEE